MGLLLGLLLLKEHGFIVQSLNLLLAGFGEYFFFLGFFFVFSVKVGVGRYFVVAEPVVNLVNLFLSEPAHQLPLSVLPNNPAFFSRLLVDNLTADLVIFIQQYIRDGLSHHFSCNAVSAGHNRCS